MIARLFEVADLEATARALGALKRVRYTRLAEDLPRLALMYGPDQLFLCTVLAMAGDAAILCPSDKSVLGRLRKMGD